MYNLKISGDVVVCLGKTVIRDTDRADRFGPGWTSSIKTSGRAEGWL
jgi:hypothetical protein